MKVAFTGTKKGMTPGQKLALARRLVALGATVLVHGACIGADDEADAIAASLGLLRIVFPSDRADRSVPVAELRRRGPVVFGADPLPALKRNPLIVKAGATLLAAPGQRREVLRSGTWTTVRHGRRLLGAEHVELLVDGLP